MGDPSRDDFHNWKPPMLGQTPGGHFPHAVLDRPAARPSAIGAC
ncbi:hypothetical protein [Streptomyces prasinus]